jgi:hypothetical protein
MKYILFLILISLSTFADDGVGKIVKKRGDVFVVRDFQTLDTQEGYQLTSKDIVVTGEEAKAKLLFSDGTKISVGKNSIFEVTEFLFDKTEKSKAKFKAKHGFFSVITGEVGKVARENFTLKTKTATIGVRGTEFEGNVSPSGEDVTCVKGVVTVSAKGKTIELKEGESLKITEDLFKPDENPEFIGEITQLYGDVFLMSGKNTSLAEIGDKLRPQDIVVTGYNSRATMKLLSGTEVMVERNSGSLANFEKGLERVTSVKGVVFVNGASIKERLDKGQFFDVKQ